MSKYKNVVNCQRFDNKFKSFFWCKNSTYSYLVHVPWSLLLFVGNKLMILNFVLIVTFLQTTPTIKITFTPMTPLPSLGLVITVRVPGGSSASLKSSNKSSSSL